MFLSSLYFALLAKLKIWQTAETYSPQTFSVMAAIVAPAIVICLNFLFLGCFCFLEEFHWYWLLKTGHSDSGDWVLIKVTSSEKWRWGFCLKYRGFIKVQVLGKLTSCEGHFATWFDHLWRNIFLIKKFSSKRFASPWKSVAFLLKMIMKLPAIVCWLANILQRASISRRFYQD